MADDARALTIVEEALGVLEPVARAALITERCGNDAELRERVEQLLAHEATDFRLLPTESFVRPLSIIDTIPDRIGPYHVTGEIARGGMGAVAKAERDDGVFARTVAIKLIRGDLASARAQARFAEERRILARLSHPGIVRILDGGEADGRPWLAMDFVDGAPITEALDARGASRAERLDAFEAVCDAVAYAHRNLVIHADIKPSNVLMSADGGVHLLDFGIARLIVGLDSEENGDPYPLTKNYAAPERGVGIAPTIASDIFSLGVLLLAMLGVETPEPERQNAPRFSAGQLEGDLGAIAAKCLNEKPEERYPDVAALLSDVRRHRAFVPVQARADAGKRYVAGRFIRRHRRGLVLAALAALALLATTAISTVSYFQAERAREEADARFFELRKLAQFMLTELGDDLNDAPGTLQARARLAAVSGQYLERLAAVRNAPADLRLDTAQGYRRLASLQGLSGTSNLGQPEKAAQSLDRAESLLKVLAREQPKNPMVLEELGRVALARWVLAADTNGPKLNAAAAGYFRAALAIAPQQTGATIGLLTTQKNEGSDLTNADRPKDALPILRAALTRLRALKLPPDLRREGKLLEVSLLARIGDAVYYAGDMAGALAPYREAKAIIDAELARAPSLLWTDKLGEAAYNISSTMSDMAGQEREALQVAQAGAEKLRHALSFGPDANIEMRLIILQGQEALILSAMGRYGDAAEIAMRNNDLREARLAAAPDDVTRQRDLAVTLATHADMLRLAGKSALACSAAQRGQALWQIIRSRGNLSGRDARLELPKMDAAARAACGR